MYVIATVRSPNMEELSIEDVMAIDELPRDNEDHESEIYKYKLSLILNNINDNWGRVEDAPESVRSYLS